MYRISPAVRIAVVLPDHNYTTSVNNPLYAFLGDRPNMDDGRLDVLACWGFLGRLAWHVRRKKKRT